MVKNQKGTTVLHGAWSNGLYMLDQVYVDALYGSGTTPPTAHSLAAISGMTRSEKRNSRGTLLMMEAVTDPMNISSANDVNSGVNGDVKSKKTAQDIDEELHPGIDEEPIDLRGRGGPKLSGAILGFDNKLERLHKEWDHISEGKIKEALRKGMVLGANATYDDVKDLKLKVCFDCMKGRMKGLPKQPVTEHPWKPFEKIGIDFKGYFPTKSYHGYRGFMLLSDAGTNYVHCVLVKSKGDNVDLLSEFKESIVDYFGHEWRIL